jgi:tellurite resistance-related uncharacterized protein
MKRPIVGFHLDAESHWVAELSCGHVQHTRHDPPFKDRPWVLTAEGRESQLGAPLECARCDRRELPEGSKAYRRTAAFTEASVPDALLKTHTTKRGVWGVIHVDRGRLEYHVSAPFHTQEVLAPGSPGVVLPEVEHRVAPLGEVEFFVEFWRLA